MRIGYFVSSNSVAELVEFGKADEQCTEGQQRKYEDIGADDGDGKAVRRNSLGLVGKINLLMSPSIKR